MEFPVKTEPIDNTPIGLKYFQTVDVMVANSKPDGKYFNISVYAPGENLPRVKILRIQSNYLDKNVGKQDEIELTGKDHRIRFNAECDPNGNYLDYPKEVSEEGTDYINDVINSFNDLIKADGSEVIINHEKKMVSKDGVWQEIMKVRRSKSPRLQEPKKELHE